MNRDISIALLSAFWLACGEPAVTSPDAGGPRPDAGGPGEVQRAGFIHLTEGGTIEVTMADLRDGVTAPGTQLIAAAGDCAVYANPPCDGTCAYPEFAPAGTIEVTGLREPMSLVPSDFWYQPEPFPTGDDLFSDDATITASAPGDVTGGFSLAARGVPALDTDVGPTVALEDGVDEVITWTPEGVGRIRLALRIGWHIQPPEGLLWCDTADDGELVIPGDLITELPRPSTFGEPHYSWMGRVSTDVVDGDYGPIELLVGNLVTIGSVTQD